MTNLNPETQLQSVEISPTDILILNLLKQARAKRELDIVEAAKRARAGDDNLERQASYSGILANEVLVFRKNMMRLNRRKLLGRSAVKIERGEVTQWPISKFGNNYYSVYTPVLFSTDAEFADGSLISEGYKFTTHHTQYGQNYNEGACIIRVIQDKITGETKQSYDFVMHLYGDEPNIVAKLRTGNIMDYVEDKNDPLYELPLGLMRLANEEITK